MKNALLVLLIIFSSAVFAADPVVVIQNAGSVTIDGRSSGSIVDVLANNPTMPNLRAKLLDAWLVYERSIIATSEARAAKVKSDAESDAASRIEVNAQRVRGETADEVAAARIAATQAERILSALRTVDLSKPLPDKVAFIVTDALRSEEDRELADIESRKASIAERQKKRPKAEKP